MKLVVQQAHYHYDAARTSGFQDINLSVQDGEVLSILGPNGCGKTTLLKCLNSLVPLHGGKILLNDRDISRLPKNEIARTIGYVPQVHQPAFPFSVLDTVLVGRAPHLGLLESPKAEDVAIAEESLETMGISHLRNKPYTQISGGERQMVIFARVLAQQPSLLLLDEPTSHLDFGNQVRLLDMVQKLASSGLPIIMTSHFPDHAFIVSNKVALMKKGAIIGTGSPDSIITDSNLEMVYGIKVKVIQVDSGINRKVCVPVAGCDRATVNLDILDKGGTMSEFEFFLKKAADYHGHICGGIALGTKITLAALKALGMDPHVKNKNLIVYTEVDRCMSDAVMIITGCSLGHRSLKHVDYGKFAATFVNQDTGRAFRATVKESFSTNGPIEEVCKEVEQTPDSELVILQEVRVNIPETDLPGFPKKKAYCATCGERIMDGREVTRDGKDYCRACANGKYYTEVK